ncbi:MAG: hypothetical protein Q9160_009287 [Pyrenula sp. 1 TL-2023]
MTNHATPETPAPLSVIIVGAGLGGCATALAMHHAGFHVRLLEKLAHFQRLGDSLGLGENALKLLKRWGLHDQLVRIGNQAADMQIRRWKDGKVLAQQPLMDMAGYIGHRGDYHAEFLKRVEECGVEVEMGRRVVAYLEEDEGKEGGEPGTAGVRLEDGEIVRGDVVVACDGIKSLAREVVLGFEDRPKGSGYACFRAFFKGDLLREEELCKEFTERDCVNIWIGEDVHLVQNTLRNGEEFNWILTHKDTEDIKESWFQPGDMSVVRAIVEDCDPRIAAAVRKTDECLDWKICYRDPIPTWRNGEDIRDRWHGFLQNLDEGKEIDPEHVKMRNRWLYPFDAEADTYERWSEVSSVVGRELDNGNITPLFRTDAEKYPPMPPGALK